MDNQRSPSLSPRRSFLSRLGLGVAAVGATLASPAAPAQAQSSGSPWQPARHAQDDWLDKLPGKHRFVFDSTMPDAFGASLLYSNNFFVANQDAYSLGNADLAVVIVARHFATPFAYNETIWAKYGPAFGKMLNVNDPQTKQPPKINIYNSAAAVGSLPSLGTTVDTVLKRGVQFAVCQMATRFIAGQLAQGGGTADAIYTELAGNLINNARLVPAGIVAVNRAQERGYSFAYVG
jgi:intracellular sulfur oxidation DsrE/DsrF family protein